MFVLLLPNFLFGPLTLQLRKITGLRHLKKWHIVFKSVKVVQHELIRQS